MIRLSLIGLLVSLVSACAPGGDFCVLYTPVHFVPEVAAVVVADDRPAAVDLDTNNRIYERVCR